MNKSAFLSIHSPHLQTKIKHTMNTKNDLTKHAPRSPRTRLGGYSILARCLDKGRASLAGSVGDYHFDCPLDNVLFSFKAVTGNEIRKLLTEGNSDDEIVQWLDAHGVPKSAEEVTEWSTGFESSTPYTNPEKKEWFCGECKSLGLNPEKATLCDMLEEDDRQSFAVQAVH
jgi:hypothetical protein